MRYRDLKVAPTEGFSACRVRRAHAAESINGAHGAPYLLKNHKFNQFIFKKVAVGTILSAVGKVGFLKHCIFPRIRGKWEFNILKKYLYISRGQFL